MSEEQFRTYTVEYLAQLRDENDLTQKDVAKIFGLRRLKTVSDWETGRVVPRETRRKTFRRYLLDDLGLNQDTQTFRDVWDDVMVDTWGWAELDEEEEWVLAQVEKAQGSRLSGRRLPPFVVPEALVGREALLNDLAQQIVNRQKLALVGKPGVGKTALTIKLAERQSVRAQYKDGVLWGSCGPQANVDEIINGWAEELQLDLSAITHPTLRRKRLREALQESRFLLILDDVWTASTAQQLAVGGAECCHLVTTRQDSVGEAFATSRYTIQIPELDDDSAVNLLASLAPRANEIAPDQVTALAKAVGGLPLSLKLLGGFLAAPESNQFTETNIAALQEVDDPYRRLQLAQERLGSSDNQALSVEQVIDLSLEQLPFGISQAYYALGAFAAKPALFSLEAAADVAQCRLQVLSLLVDRNLLERTRDEQLTLHQVLADHARIHTEAEAYTRHYQYYLSQVQENPGDWQLIQPIFAQLQQAQQQLAKALEHNYEQSRVLLDLLGTYMRRRGLWREYFDWASQLLEVARAQGKELAVSSLLLNLGWMHDGLGEREQALGCYREALALKQKHGEQRGSATALSNISSSYEAVGNYEEALDYAQQALAVWREVGDREGEATALNNLGGIQEALGPNEEALDAYFEALEIWQALNNREGEATTHINLASSFSDLGDDQQASRHLEQGMTLFEAMGHLSGQATVHNNRAELCYKNEEYQQALALFERALTIRREIGERSEAARTYSNIASIYMELGREDEALSNYLYALAEQRAVADLPGQLNTLSAVAGYHQSQENYQVAINYLLQAREVANQLPDRENRVLMLLGLGESYFEMEDVEKALRYWQEAAALSADVENPRLEYVVRRNVVEAYLALDEEAEQSIDLRPAVAEQERVVQLNRFIFEEALQENLELLDYLRDHDDSRQP